MIRALPVSLRPYALLMRLDRPIGTWLLLLPGWWALTLAGRGQGGRVLTLMALFAVGAVVMRGAGCIVNDLWDRDLDAKVERTRERPLASGAVSVRQAIALLITLAIIGLAVLGQLPRAAILTGIASLPFIVLYPAMKRITWWPQAFLGLTFNFGALVGWTALRGQIDPAAWLLYAAGFFWTLGYDTIYAHQDIADDIAAGVKSTARRLGRWNKPFIAACYAACWLSLQFALHLAGSGLAAHYALVLPGAHFIWQVARWDIARPDDALRVFRSNRDAGLLVLLACLLYQF